VAGKGMRAYNLASELGLEREELIKKAAEIGIEIRNPMASLDDEQVATIRRRLSSAPSSDTVQKRVGTGVIRRRKKKDEPDSAADLEALEEPAAAAAPASEVRAPAETEFAAAPGAPAPIAPV